MKKVILSFVLALSIFMVGCKTFDTSNKTEFMLDVAQTTTALIRVKPYFEMSSASLKESLYLFSADEQEKLLEVYEALASVEKTVKDHLQGAKSGTVFISVTDLDKLYLHVRVNYISARQIISSHMSQLPPETQYQLLILDRDIQRLDGKVSKLLADIHGTDATQTVELVLAAIQQAATVYVSLKGLPV